MVHRLDIMYWPAFDDRRISAKEAREWIAEAKQVGGKTAETVMWDCLDRYADSFDPTAKAEVEQYLEGRAEARYDKGPSLFERLSNFIFGQPDLDGDGLSDQQEQKLHTNPFRADTDRDGFTDAAEVARGTDAGRFA